MVCNPLDVGAAAFKYCKKGVNRHSENERSLSEFAKSVGYSKSAITEYIAAFMVADDFRVRMPELYETARVRIKSLPNPVECLESNPRRLPVDSCDDSTVGIVNSRITATNAGQIAEFLISRRFIWSVGVKAASGRSIPSI